MQYELFQVCIDVVVVGSRSHQSLRFGCTLWKICGGRFLDVRSNHYFPTEIHLQRNQKINYIFMESWVPCWWTEKWLSIQWCKQQPRFHTSEQWKMVVFRTKKQQCIYWNFSNIEPYSMWNQSCKERLQWLAQHFFHGAAQTRLLVKFWEIVFSMLERQLRDRIVVTIIVRLCSK